MRRCTVRGFRRRTTSPALSRCDGVCSGLERHRWAWPDADCRFLCWLSLSLAVIAAQPALACGPYFANEVLADRERSLLDLPAGAFRFEVTRLVPAPHPRFVEATVQGDAYWGADDPMVAQRQAAERADLDEREAAIVALMRAQSAAGAFALGQGLTADVRHYVAGAVAWHEGAWDAARAHFEQSLAANGTADARRAVWAHYMLGRVAARLGDVESTRSHFAQVRVRVAAGAPDRLGLAAASFGEEAALASTPVQALALYVAQASTGSQSGIDSVLWLTRRAFADPAELVTWLADPLARRIAVVYAFAKAGDLVLYDPEYSEADSAGRPAAIERLLNVIEATPDAQLADSGVDRLAAVAYRAGRFDLAQRFAGLGTSPLSSWVQAKLLLRAGDRDGAAQAFARAASGFPATERWHRDGVESLRHPQCQVNAERATLALARGEYTTAMTAMLAAGSLYWPDAQYVAERVLAIDELQSFVDREAPTAPEAATGSPPSSTPDADFAENRHGDVHDLIRDLLARRLMRAGRFEEALPYFHDAVVRDAAARYATAVRRARDGWFWFDRVGRAEAWFDAATIARKSGMEILGMEGFPDYAIDDGAYGREPGDFGPDGQWIPEPPRDIVLDARWAGPDEGARLVASAPPFLSRFHYRQVAAAHVMQAADYVPARSQAFAAMLCTGTRWLIDRQRAAALVLYQRYVDEGALVPFGTTFGGTCPAPAFDRARDRLQLERVRALESALRQPASQVVALLLVAVFAAGAVLLWKRRARGLTNGLAREPL